MALVLDQQNITAYNTSDDFGRTSLTRVAQSFVPSVTAGRGRVSLYLRRVGTVTDNVFVQICANNAGDPGTVIGTSADYVGSSISTDFTAADFDFSPATSVLNAGTTYWIVIARDGALSDVNYYEILGNVPSSYASGENSVEASGSWFDGNDTDEYFQEYYDDTTIPAPAPSNNRRLLLNIG
jgi:hypothetical protein